MFPAMLGAAGAVGSMMGGGGGSQTPAGPSSTASATATVGPISTGGNTFGPSTGVRGAFYNNAFSPGMGVSTSESINAPAPYEGYLKWGVLGLLVLMGGAALILKAKG